MIAVLSCFAMSSACSLYFAAEERYRHFGYAVEARRSHAQTG